MENQNVSMVQRFSQWLKKSLFIKLLSIGFLVLLLMVPIVMIQDSISERQLRQQEAIFEVSQSWGGAQTVVGPVLSIPYSKWIEFEDNKRKEERHIAHFLPLSLKIDGDLKHQIRQRGIFDVVLYQSDMTLKGDFEKPDFQSLHVESENIHWEEAKLSLGISGMAGIKEVISLQWGDESFRMEPGTAYPALLPSGVSVEVPLKPEGEMTNFSIPLKLNGSDFFKLAPAGKETSVALKSDWHSPSFTGEFLPDQREISLDGFSANWQILDLNRNYPQQWTDKSFDLGQANFGVRLIQPVDEYQKNTRSAKYAILVIGLTFLIYFFFETLQKFHIHPFQYLLIGLALSVFYLLLLSLSEQIGFNFAYLAAAVSTIFLIVGYSASVLKVRRLIWQLALLLIAIYGFIFVVLQLEDYALLVGSIGIFAALAATMYYSRNVDWYRLGE